MELPIKRRSIGALRQTVIPFIFIFFVPHGASGQNSTSAQRLERVAALIVENRLVEAEQQLKSLLNVAPKSAAAVYLLGSGRGKQGRRNSSGNPFPGAGRAENSRH